MTSDTKGCPYCREFWKWADLKALEAPTLQLRQEFLNTQSFIIGVYHGRSHDPALRMAVLAHFLIRDPFLPSDTGENSRALVAEILLDLGYGENLVRNLVTSTGYDYPFPERGA